MIDTELFYFFFLVQTNETSIAKRIKVQSHPRDNYRGRARQTKPPKTTPETPT
jgi:hypothetical protein